MYKRMIPLGWLVRISAVALLLSALVLSALLASSPRASASSHAPPNIEVGRGSHNITMTWDAFPSSGGYQFGLNFGHGQGSPREESLSFRGDANLTSFTFTNLTPLTDYTLFIRTCNPACASNSWTARDVTTAANYPNPRNLQAELVNSGTQIRVAWEAPANFIIGTLREYHVFSKRSNSSQWNLDSHHFLDTYGLAGAWQSHTFPAWTPGVRYDVLVRACNQNHQCSPGVALENLVVPDTPQKMTQIIGHPWGSDGVILFWEPPNDNGAAITGYQVRHRHVDVSDWTLVNTNSTREGHFLEISGLDDRQGPTFFQVRAINSRGSGPWSDSVVVAAKPSVPANLTATGYERVNGLNSGVRFSWDPPSDDGGKAISTYHYQYRASGANSWGILWVVEDARTHVDVPGLHHNTSYEFRVYASNGHRWSPFVSTSVSGRPAGPGGLRAEPVSGTQDVSLSWNAHADATGYLYHHRKTGGGVNDWHYAGVTEGATTATVRGLEPDTEYDFRVRTETAQRTGWFSAPVSARTGVVSVVSIADASAEEGEEITFQVSLSHAASQEVKLEWSAADGSATSPDDYFGPGGGLLIPAGQTTATFAVTTVPDTEDEGDESFTVTLAPPSEGLPASVLMGQATATGTILNDDAPMPSQVAGLEITSGIEEITLSWNPVSGATGYKVQWKSGAQDFGESRQATTGETGHTITDLVGGTQYTVRVIATGVAEGGDGPPSAELTGIPAAAAPAQVTGLQVTAQADSLAVSWDAVPEADGFELHWDSDGVDVESHVLSGRETSYVITGLKPGREYAVWVVATRRYAENGAPSARQTGTPLSGAPGQVTGLYAQGRPSSVDLFWDVTTGADGYRVQWRSGSQDYDGSREINIRSQQANSISITGEELAAGVQYRFRVIAYRTHEVDGQATHEDLGAPSAEVTGIRKFPAPDQVTGVAVEEQVESLSVTWNPASSADGYLVQWKSGSQSYDSSRQAQVDDTFHVIAGLEPGVEYSVQVIATRTNADDGKPSSAATGVPQSAAPGQVAGVTVTPGDGELIVSWTALEGATSYKVQWKSGDEDYDSSRQATASETTYSITGLEAGTEYTVRVIATNTHETGDNQVHSDDGPPSQEVTGTPAAS